MASGMKDGDSSKTKKNELFSKDDKTGLESSGLPIPNPLRHVMETAMGADLSDIKVHSDANAHKMATLLSADAFSYGDHIVFGGGKYLPGDSAAQKLLAHEVTHVMQQRSGKKSDQGPQSQ